MRQPMAAILASGLILAAAGVAVASGKEAPKQVVFETKQGAVTFDHAGHLAAAKNDCKACHDTLFPQVKAPLGYKDALHKKAETAKASCGACHHPAGPAFESKGNCQKCHVKT